MEETGECGDQELNHSDGQAEKFYRDLKERGISVRVGMESTDIHAGSSDCWRSWGSSMDGRSRGDQSQASEKQKFDREDARLILRLMRENNFPQVWVPGRRIGICDNCCGTGIGWCRCAHGS